MMPMSVQTPMQMPMQTQMQTPMHMQMMYYYIDVIYGYGSNNLLWSTPNYYNNGTYQYNSGAYQSYYIGWLQISIFQTKNAELISRIFVC